MPKKGLVIGLVVVGAAALAVAALSTAGGAVPAPTPPEKFVCPLCGLEFATYDELYQHWITAHPPEVREITWE